MTLVQGLLLAVLLITIFVLVNRFIDGIIIFIKNIFKGIFHCLKVIFGKADKRPKKTKLTKEQKLTNKLEKKEIKVRTRLYEEYVQNKAIFNTEYVNAHVDLKRVLMKNQYKLSKLAEKQTKRNK